MKECPFCGANVEGLVNRCDCCGANFITNTDLFVENLFMTGVSGDLPNYVRPVLKQLNAGTFREYFESYKTIVFVIYAYPQSMVTELALHDKKYISTKRKKAIFTHVILCEEWAQMTSSQKKSVIQTLILDSLLALERRKKYNSTDQLSRKLKDTFRFTP